MSANVESMFYVRETPWHGLGTRVENAATSKEALKLSGLDWLVEQYPIHANGRLIEDKFANVRSSDNKTLGIVSNRYQIVQNHEAFEFTDELLKHDCLYETAGSLNEGRSTWLLAKLPSRTIINDEVIPYLVFSNSHDGSGAIRVALTPIRVVCQNTLNFALKGAPRSWSTRHMGNLNNKMEAALNALELADKYMDNLNMTAFEMANKIVSEADFKHFMENLFPFPAEKESTPRKIENVETVRNNLNKIYTTASDIQEYKGTAYGVINAVSDMITHYPAMRNTPLGQEKMFGKVINGHSIIDEAYALLKK